MADLGAEDVVDLEGGIELELEVSFNEFDDELIQDGGNIAEDKNGLSTDKIFNAAKVCSVPSICTDGCGKADDGEIRNSDKEVDVDGGSHELSGKLAAKGNNLIQTLGPRVKAGKSTEFRKYQKDRSKTKETNTIDRQQRKRRGSFSMEVDDESDPEEPGKPQEVGCDDNTTPRGEERGDKVKKHVRGGKKKKPRRQSPNPDRRHRHQDRDFDTEIRDLFRPLNVTHKDTVEDVANELCDRLQERKFRLIHRVVKTIGCSKALELLDETKKVQIRGGMTTQDGSRRRTSGGIFLTLMKSDRFTTKEQTKEIFAEEAELLKNAKKARKDEEKEQNRKKIEDLRTKLQNERKLPKDVEMKTNE